ncbi:MAG: hypothetical protein ACOVQI_12885, partial [Tagaea sp.]
MSASPAPDGRSDRPLLGIAYMAFGVFLLSVMDTIAKYAVGQMSSPVLIAIRSAMVLIVLAPFVVRAGGL